MAGTPFFIRGACAPVKKLLFLVNSLFFVCQNKLMLLVFMKNMIPKGNSWLLMASRDKPLYSNRVFPDNHLKGRKGEPANAPAGCR